MLLYTKIKEKIRQLLVQKKVLYISGFAIVALLFWVNNERLSTIITNKKTDEISPKITNINKKPTPKKDTIVLTQKDSVASKTIKEQVANSEETTTTTESTPKAKFVAIQPAKNHYIPENTLTFEGMGTYYHSKFHGRRTASGDIYNENLFTAAVRRDAVPLPFGTIVEVSTKRGSKKVRVKINDRMHDEATAILDLSRAAAKELGLIHAGRKDIVIRVVPTEEELQQMEIANQTKNIEVLTVADTMTIDTTYKIEAIKNK